MDSVNSSRRSFLRAGTAALATVACAPAIAAARPEHDLVIRGGTVVDGTGAPGRALDVGITGDRITTIASRVSRGREEIDARGRVVAPGFVDIHSHGDGSIDADPRVESVVRQGITTMVVGADGSSRFDGTPARSFGAWASHYDGLRAGPNAASMIGLGTVRGAVIGDDDRRATADEIATMTAMVERSLAEGACGASSGLEYTPGAFAALDELRAVCGPLAARGLPYMTHLRNEDDRLLEAIDEAIAVAQGAGCPLQISHLKTQGPRNWPKLDAAFARLAAARAAGLDVAFDRYPYLAYSTGLTNLFPVWSRDGGTAAFLARVADAATADRIRRETLAKVELIGGWNNVQISSVRVPADRMAEGRRLGDHARQVGGDPYDVAVALLQRNGGNVGMLGFAMSEENLERILQHPLGMVCTDGGGFAADGPARRGSPHPRGIGSFPRVLARYVRERRTLTLEAAVHKMTALPAGRVRLADRGRLAPGMAADVVVFDAARVADTATFDSPFQYPTGIDVVIVNGAISLRDGVRAATGAGRALRVGA